MTMILKLTKPVARILTTAVGDVGVDKLMGGRWEFSEAAMEKIRTLTWDRLMRLRGVGEKTAQEIVITLNHYGIVIPGAPKDVLVPLRLRKHIETES